MSLSRRLEPEVMDSPDEAAAYDDMDHSSVNATFVKDLMSAHPFGDSPIAESEILDLGTGTARIPIELCRRVPEIRVVAGDLSIAMLDVARINLELSGMIDRVLLAHIDAKQLEMSDDRFSMIISNSLLHHLPEPMVCLREAVRVAKPGASLFFRDLMRPETTSELNRLVTEYAGHEADEARRMFEDSLHAALRLEEIQSFVVELGFGPETVTATSDRHWTWSVKLPT